MPRSKPKHISFLLKKKSFATRELVQHSVKLLQLEQLVHDSLPNNLAQHCRMANYRENNLILHVDSALWSSKLRFHIPAMKYDLKVHPEFVQLKNITIKTKPNYNRHETLTRQKASMTRSTADSLNNLADYVTSESLATALRKLSRHGGKETK
ncbi:MAG: DUF721 domain-containing protein [Gammaproteobacteria bacterium]|nr:DUF721 domain-containing protein [Gammaproteobacteria bacterium]